MPVPSTSATAQSSPPQSKSFNEFQFREHESKAFTEFLSETRRKFQVVAASRDLSKVLFQCSSILSGTKVADVHVHLNPHDTLSLESRTQHEPERRHEDVKRSGLHFRGVFLI